jgi:hypothetical protein
MHGFIGATHDIFAANYKQAPAMFEVQDYYSDSETTTM